jgi:hypothetical protein
MPKNQAEATGEDTTTGPNDGVVRRKNGTQQQATNEARARDITYMRKCQKTPKQA